MGSSPDRVQPMTIKLAFVAPPLSTMIARSIKEKEQKQIGSELGKCARVGRHVYPRTFASVIYPYKNLTKRVGLVQSGHHYPIECNLFWQ